MKSSGHCEDVLRPSLDAAASVDSWQLRCSGAGHRSCSSPVLERGLQMRGWAMVEVTQRLDTIVVPGHAGSLTPLQPPPPPALVTAYRHTGFSGILLS